ncbi:hypothetical protein SAMN05444287_0759 [Octadecabacter temperatus]|uniref:Uncharacterized protein n=1 Tax=Octadecabacter temperatus TaxID=1458307 RepID=A0A0K0Y433_9RHOB|nr:hypothetical protein [Octadecabacter temperatus]AKS45661.1 hypothetical protein OSB_11050 [Octadecabacter temperatus]SIN97816.1 hypothetical protein SAMN05444287_0759 [Octadecabacter temperatus]
MTYEWLILGAVLIVALLPMIKWVRRLLWAFTIAFVGMMLIHMQHNPGEATLALGAMGGGLMFARPIRRMVLGGML